MTEGGHHLLEPGPREAAVLSEGETPRDAELDRLAARAELVDTLGSRLLGVERGTAIEAFLLRHRRALLAANVAPLPVMVFGGAIHPTVGVIGSWSFLLFGGPTCALVWLSLRARPLALLIKRPAAWALVGATLCKTAIHIAAYPTVRAVCIELLLAPYCCVLPMVDAMPHELVRVFARYACAAGALLFAYIYCDWKFLNPEAFATKGPGRLWAWRVADRGGREHEILSSGSLILTCWVVIIAVFAQLALFAWMNINNCLVVREDVPLSELHPQSAEGGAVTVGDKLLGCKRGAAVQRWLCTWQHVLVGVPSALAVLSFFVDWVLDRHDTAQAAVDLLLSASIAVLLGVVLLCNRLSVTKRALSGKPANWYYLVSCTLAWSAMLVWRGPKEAWTWWLKACMFMLLSLSVLFIDALPVQMHTLLGRVGLPVITAVSAATYLMLKARTADMYSKYQPPELRDVAGFITLSSYHRCCNFLFFQASKSLYKVHSMWSNPGHAVFLATAPKRDELYTQLYRMPCDRAEGAATELPPLLGAAMVTEPAEGS